MRKARRSSVQLYETMRDAIAYMRQHADTAPSINEIAKAVGMSRSRFEHAFGEWAGIAPKRFLSSLENQRAKAELKRSGNVLGAAYRSRLSGPGKLHRLLVTHEGASPGEFLDGSIRITYGILPSPFGWCVIGLTRRGICALHFLEKADEEGALRTIRTSWPHATLTRNDTVIKPYIQKLFGLSRGKILVVLKGTNFQIKVWEALLAIPDRQTSTYAEIAKTIGKPKAVRAVGSACGKNAIAFLIPCHRVLASNGDLGGYRWGQRRKDVILLAEKTHLL